MRKKLQKLKRRNTDSLLSAAIMTVRGSNRITQADAIEWGSSFESLLTDKSKFFSIICKISVTKYTRESIFMHTLSLF